MRNLVQKEFKMTVHSNSDFASKNLTVGQVNALVKTVGGHESVLKILDGSLKFTLITFAVDTFLTPTYFTTQPKKLWVSDAFTQRITAAYSEPLTPRGIKGVQKAFDLQRKMYDGDFIKQMGGEAEVRKFAFTPDQIASMIDAQPNSIDGAMLNNGYANIFYVIGVDGGLFAVDVDWRSHDSVWGAFAFKLDEFGRCVDDGVERIARSVRRVELSFSGFNSIR